MLNPEKVLKLLLSGVICLVLASSASAQFGGFGKKDGGKDGGGKQPGGGKDGGGKDWGGKGGGMFGGGGWDPSKMFDNIAKGKDHIVIADLQWGKQGLEEFAKDNGITDGKITREQYLKYSEDKKNGKYAFKWGGQGGGQPFKFGGGDFKFGGGDFKPGDIKMMKPGDAPKGPPVMNAPKDETPEEFEKRLLKKTEEYFKSRDANKDGFLSFEEMSGTLKEHYKKFDKNNDNLISFDECKEYMRAYMKGELGNKKGDHPSGADIIDLDALDERPEVYTASKLPAGLPDWFAKLDTDQDGQIGLYEWIAANKSVKEFKEIDRNDDGFLTPEEVLYHIQITSAEKAGTAIAADTSPGAGTGIDKGKDKKKMNKGGDKK